MWGTLPEVFDRACLHHADSTAIVDGEWRLTYRQMRQQANQVANGLVALGVGKGERVGLLLPNVAEFIPTQYGIWKAGAVLVQMPARASASVHHANLRQAAATTLIYHSQFDQVIADLLDNEPIGIRHLVRLRPPGADATTSGPSSAAGTAGALIAAGRDYQCFFGAQPGDTAPEVPLDEHDEAYVLFTSGSTGEPKGVINSHFTWAHYSITAGLEIGDIRPGEIFAHGAPLTHFTQIFVMPTFLRGGTNVMLPGLDVDRLLATIEREKVTATAVVPTIVYLLLDHPGRAAFDLSSLRTMIYAGAPISPERLREALDAFGPIFVQAYAGTEPGYVSCLRKEEHVPADRADGARLASAGRPLPFVRVSIQDDTDKQLPTGEVGEICSRQLGQMIGYLDSSRDAETLRDGWVHTGDVGFLDADGFLHLVDRKKDLIVSGGFNVFPRQVEDVLATHPAVAQAAVIGVPHPKWGEAVHAVVVLRGGRQAETAELIDHVRRQLGGVPAPKTVELVDALPVNPAGKVDKKSLRSPFWVGRARRIS
ncbi:Acyl-CoA synthetase (AMP-forming)/AMP-acid ligase II [Frankia canadensis]|uniref:Acyl-CoA synthetase (AMP-forming)/AMP-acid ligase II n=1 Tax=Frankia canadensis TaxID=1836972 RepID=A0A2I2KPT1_9ACTN|nr:AMP-binding protein [Frankia canadensis]SNQ47678.1 Acyl-CoA synthetase (AMP-forming)/AMP-acid ligase II [Frankia canadensis]SOU54968.1 Acyl-CoA synthetase (AMP-forming)/AMP-acid ligase II [Frankia canadensis]